METFDRLLMLMLAPEIVITFAVFTVDPALEILFYLFFIYMFFFVLFFF